MNGIDMHLREVSEFLEDRGDDFLLCITADHGMSDKRVAINLEITLRRYGIKSKLNSIIADRYVVHHRNLGGAAYIYLKKPEETLKALKILRETEGVEAALTRDEASKLYHLDKDRIGDILVLGEKDYVFGLLDQERIEVSMRSHGSLHESRVPIIINEPTPKVRGIVENKDVAEIALNWLITRK